MKRTIIFAFIFFNTLISYGQKQHLEPATFDVIGSLENYYRNLNTNFYNGLSEIPFARFIVIPSFSKEYAFSIEKKNEEYFVVSITPSESYWRAKNKENVKFENNKNKIDKNFYLKIGRLFQLLDKQTKNYDTEIYNLDGETYYFITADSNGKTKIGKTWSPAKNSLMGSLIKISNDLYSIGNGNYISISEINNEIDKLIIGFKK